MQLLDVLRGLALFGVLVANLVWYECDVLTRAAAAALPTHTIDAYAKTLVVSAWWLRRFRFGPVEWLWRSLTYGRAQPMRVERAGAQART